MNVLLVPNLLFVVFNSQTICFHLIQLCFEVQDLCPLCAFLTTRHITAQNNNVSIFVYICILNYNNWNVGSATLV